MDARRAVCLGLVLAVAAVFGQTLDYNFINYDDNQYVFRNTDVSSGLSARGVAWAFSQRHANNWHPLTWLSHMLDCQLYGLEPWGHHLTNVLLHAATAVVLFLVLQCMTGGLWPSALAAALFAVHPLRVESVAWVSERKDVLSGLFFVLCLGAYAGYVRRPGAWSRYLMLILLYVFGLMSKPILVTLPAVLLFLDFWPLGRFSHVSPLPLGEGQGVRAESDECANALTLALSRRERGLARLVLEKLPLIALSAAACLATIWAQSGAISGAEYVPLPWRIGNAVVSYAVYIGQMFYPVGLAVLYPHPGVHLPLWQAAAAALVLTAITAASLVGRRRYPFLLAGWLWYLVMLLPVIGLIQVGRQAHADRYTYLPQIGLAVALAWTVAELVRLHPGWKRWLATVSTLWVIVMAIAAIRQTTYWRDSPTLWARALARGGANPTAHLNLGVAWANYDQLDSAIVELRLAIQEDPDFVKAHFGLGVVLEKQGKLDEAMAQYRRTIELDPEHPEAPNALGAALVGQGKVSEAIPLYRKAIELKPDFAEAHNNLGAALEAVGEDEEAALCYERAIQLKSDYAEAHNNLGTLLGRRGQLDEAIDHFQRALQIDPSHPKAANNLRGAIKMRQKK